MRRLVSVTLVAISSACGPVVQLPAGSSDGSGSSTADDEDSGRGTTGTTGSMSTTGRPTTTRVDTGGLDEGPRLDLDPECVDWPFGGCGQPSARGSVEGTTPLGDFATPLAVFGSDVGCGGVCSVEPNIAQVHLVADPALIPELQPWSYIDESLAIELAPWDAGGGFEGPLGRPVTARLYASRDGVTVETDAEVVIDYLPTVDELSDPFDPRNAVVVSGSVMASGDGWNVAGTFAASFCPEVDRYVICE